MTAPEPTVCQLCFGDGWAVVPGDEDLGWRAEIPCPACCCDRCGTDVYTRGEGPQLCNDCAEDIGDRAYERRRDR